MARELGPWEQYQRYRDVLLAQRASESVVELAALRASRKRRDAWAIGHHLNRIFDRALWIAPPYESGMRGRWLREVLPELPQRTAYEYMRVARHFTRDDVEKWGPRLLASLARHDRARFSKERSGDPGEWPIYVPKADGSWKSTSLNAGATVRDLALASKITRRNRRRSLKSHAPVFPQDA